MEGIRPGLLNVRREMAKIKCRPEDFQVEEVIDVTFREEGRYAWYRARKQGLTTRDLIRNLSRWTGIPARRFSHGGLKDKHAVTVQYLSLEGDGPERISLKNVEVERAGYADERHRAALIRGNRFRIVLRDLDRDELDTIARNAAEMADSGFPNYYDDQRFAVPQPAENSVGIHLLKRRYEPALRSYVEATLGLTFPRSRKQVPEILARWGRWEEILGLPALPASFRRAVEYLVQHPNDFQGAIYQVDLFDLKLAVASIQSFFWNEALARLLHRRLGRNVIWQKGAWQEYAFYRQFDSGMASDLKDLAFAVPSAKFGEEPREIRQIYDEVLAEFDLQMEDFRLPGLRGVALSEHERKAIVFPQDFRLSEPGPDELHAGKFSQTMEFFLPSGSYATMVVRRLLL